MTKAKNIEATVTILFSEKGMSIEVRDETSRVQFLNIQLTSEQACQAMSRLASVECKVAEVLDLHKVGLVKVTKPLVFKVPQYCYSDKNEFLKNLAEKFADEGWEPQFYFGSRDSFFEENGKRFARTTQSKWVDESEKANV